MLNWLKDKLLKPIPIYSTAAWASLWITFFLGMTYETWWVFPMVLCIGITGLLSLVFAFVKWVNFTQHIPGDGDVFALHKVVAGMSVMYVTIWAGYALATFVTGWWIVPTVVNLFIVGAAGFLYTLVTWTNNYA